MTVHPLADLGGYVLGVLSADETPAVRRHLEECAQCRDRVNGLDGISELLAAGRLVPAESPRLAPRILSTLPPQGQAYALGRGQPEPEPALRTPAPSSRGVETPRRHTPRTPRPPGPGRPRRKTRLALALVALAIGAAVILGVALTRSDSGDVVMLVPSGTDAAGSATFTRTATGTTILLDIHGLEPGVYEATVDDGTGIYSAGTFRVGEDGSAKTRLQTAATEGELQVSASGAGSERALLRALLPG